MRGAVDRAHAAPADFAFDAKSPGDDLGGVHLLTLSFGKEGRSRAARTLFSLSSGASLKKRVAATKRRE